MPQFFYNPAYGIGHPHSKPEAFGALESLWCSCMLCCAGYPTLLYIIAIFFSLPCDPCDQVHLKIKHRLAQGIFFVLVCVLPGSFSGKGSFKQQKCTCWMKQREGEAQWKGCFDCTEV